MTRWYPEIRHALVWQVGVMVSLLLALSPLAQSQPVPTPEPHTTQSIIDALKPDPGTARGRTRGLSLDLPESSASKPRTPAAAPAAEARHVDLQVHFEFDSDRLTEDGRDLLGKLALALASHELSGVRSVTIEGHTDGVGSAVYNLGLSLRRAQAVRSFLQTVPALGGRKLSVVGKGESELLRPEDPADGINRRVRVLVFHAPERAREQP